MLSPITVFEREPLSIVLLQPISTLFPIMTMPTCGYLIFLILVVIFSFLIMFRVKQINGNTFKIAVGLFFSVILYYINNFFYVLGNTEKINLSTSILIPLIILIFINSIMMVKINER